ncbi:hypothetical protein, partial [Neisseria iguanae]|uniref:hypothetical protein n=1 Tax=Neisseria iguanae TaxID=90242 RepID=UPI001B80263A
RIHIFQRLVIINLPRNQSAANQSAVAGYQRMLFEAGKPARIATNGKERFALTAPNGRLALYGSDSKSRKKDFEPPAN